MSDLRKQLDAARRDYRAQKYRGDLAAELLGAGESASAGNDLADTGAAAAERDRRQHLSRHLPRHRGMRIGGFAALVSGLAAAVVVWINTRPAADTDPAQPRTQVATTAPAWPQDDVTVAIVDPSEAVDHVEASEPDEGADDAQTLAEMPSLPSFPSDMSLVPPALPVGEMESMFSIPSPDVELDGAEPANQEESA